MSFVLDPRLAEILACPAPDHGTLVAGTPADPAADALTCTVCRRSYPVVDGIPVLLLEDAFGDGAPRDPGTEPPARDPVGGPS